MAKAKDKQEQINELLKKVETGVQEVFTGERYRTYLKTMSKFHNYSFRNNLLILMQKPDAAHVAGYAAWQNKFNRQVRKGEKGIQIIGYMPKTIQTQSKKLDQDGNTAYDIDGKPVTETTTRQIPSFAPVYVYDVSQTEGEPLPTLVNELTGSVEGYNDLFSALRQASPFPIDIESIKGTAKGYCDYMNRRIVIKEGLSEVHSVKTAIHEITHADLHAPQINLTMDERPDQATREIEAESTAFVVCNHYNIDTSDYTFAYLATWSTLKELPELKSSLETIQKQATDLISRIDSRLLEIQKERQTGIGQLPNDSHGRENQRRDNEILDSVKFDNDIDLDRERTREQLGFKDNEKESLADRFAAAKTRAEQHNSLMEKPIQKSQEREV